MQSNTTGHSMEIFLIITVLILLIALFCLEIFHFYRLTQRYQISSETLSAILDTLIKQNEKIGYLNKNVMEFEGLLHSIMNENQRSMLSLVDNLQTAKPIKPNNFDSLREAFKGPTRVEINERN